ncbi:MAG TPA: DUF1360 domain-containing protein [Trebonia sp.]|jgi:hypothetical protein|nr:DUF1360 domain-containing protein [Trebonia sp.]
MTVLTDIKDKATGVVRSSERGYNGDGDEKQPLAGYLGTMSVYGAVAASIAAAARAAGREIPDGFDTRQVLLAAAATYKLSRMLAKDPVTSPLRAPFTRFEGTAGPAEVNEEVRGTGAQRTVGELISCPFCLGVWTATGLTAGLIFLPRATRLAIGTLAALAGADLLQYAHAWLEQQTS